jgi:hypothetical protein
MKGTILTRIDRMAKHITKSKLDGLETSISNMVDKAVSSILGLERDNWGRVGYTIDHCNSRQSFLITKSQELGCKALEKILSKMAFSDVEEARIMEAVKKEVESGFERKVKEHYEKRLDQLISNFLDNWFKEKAQEIEKDIKSSIGLIENIVLEQKK